MSWYDKDFEKRAENIEYISNDCSMENLSACYTAMVELNALEEDIITIKNGLTDDEYWIAPYVYRNKVCFDHPEAQFCNILERTFKVWDEICMSGKISSFDAQGKRGKIVRQITDECYNRDSDKASKKAYKNLLGDNARDFLSRISFEVHSREEVIDLLEMYVKEKVKGKDLDDEEQSDLNLFYSWDQWDQIDILKSHMDSHSAEIISHIDALDKIKDKITPKIYAKAIHIIKQQFVEKETKKKMEHIKNTIANTRKGLAESEKKCIKQCTERCKARTKEKEAESKQYEKKVEDILQKICN